LRLEAFSLRRCARQLTLLLALSNLGCSAAGSDAGTGRATSEGGASGIGGNAGLAGAGGTTGGSGGVRIIRGDPNQTTWFSLTIEGHGLANDEGKLVTARIGIQQRPPERLGLGQVRIQDGTFRIEFPQGCEEFLYKQKLLFIDVDANGSCTPGVDRVYTDSRFQTSDITLTLSDSVPAPPGNAQMRLSSTDPSPSSDCERLNEAWPEL
jgi:hypothetical protein